MLQEWEQFRHYKDEHLRRDHEDMNNSVFTMTFKVNKAVPIN